MVMGKALKAILETYELKLTSIEMEKLIEYAQKQKMNQFNALLGEHIAHQEIITFIVVLPQSYMQPLIPIANIICNKKIDGGDFNDLIISQHNWKFIKTEFSFLNTTIPTYLGSSLWTCACKENFIKTTFHNTCPLCGKKQTDALLKYKPLKELFIVKD